MRKNKVVQLRSTVFFNTLELTGGAVITESSWLFHHIHLTFIQEWNSDPKNSDWFVLIIIRFMLIFDGYYVEKQNSDF